MEAKVQSAVALSTLVLHNEANQLSIASGLVRVLTHGSNEVQEQACDLVKNLSAMPQEGADNRAALARAGAIPQLVSTIEPQSRWPCFRTTVSLQPSPCFRFRHLPL